MTERKLLSLLLQYPTAELLDAHSELAAAAATLPDRAARSGSERLLASFEGRSLGELQQTYVETFDFDRRASLHLTYHTHGDRRQRGLELVRLKRRYAEAGLELAEGELPDYLPVLLEFAALEPATGGELLSALRESLELVRSRLHERESPYAGLLDAVVEGLPKLTRAQRERIERLAEEGPPAELVGLEPFAPPELVPATGGLL